VRLSGLQPGEDIEIAIVGLRPGERRHELLVDRSETLSDTAVPNLRVARSDPPDADALDEVLDDLLGGLDARDPDDTVALLLRIVDTEPSARLLATAAERAGSREVAPGAPAS